MIVLNPDKQLRYKVLEHIKPTNMLESKVVGNKFLEECKKMPAFFENE